MYSMVGLINYVSLDIAQSRHQKMFSSCMVKWKHLTWFFNNNNRLKEKEQKYFNKYASDAVVQGDLSERPKAFLQVAFRIALRIVKVVK